MKKFYTISILLIFLFAGYFTNSQTVDKYAQDGKLVFQFKLNHRIDYKMHDEKYFDFNSIEFLSKVSNNYGIESVYYLHPNIRDERLKRTVEIAFNEIHKIDELINYLKDFDFISYAESKELHYHFFSPNDEYYGQQYQWNLFKINAEAAWDISTGNSNIVVAVTDDAIYTSHPDLENKMVAGFDVAEDINDPNPAGQADGFHGTHVSGIVGAETNNGIGIASIGFDVSIMPIKIARNSDGALVAGYDGIIWAADNNADVINMSWGGGNAGTYGQNVCNYAWNAGSILVAAAGNDNESTVFYPAGYNNVIAVASTASDDSKSGFSQYGNWIDISAPGSNIVSCNESGGYAQAGGTSMASPLVAGLMGLMKSASPTMSNLDLIDCLYSSADNIDAQNPGYINQLGHGRINAHEALICVTASAADLDAGIESIIQPTGGTCVNVIEPMVVLKNYGAEELNSVTINYQVVGQNSNSVNWTGNLAQGETELVSLSTITVNSTGEQAFRAYTSDPNGEQDGNPFNDEKIVSFGIFVTGLPIPWTEDFESQSFNTNLWSIENPDLDITWDIYEIEGTEPGNHAAGINLFNYTNAGERDAMLSPPLSFEGYESVELTFEHAYRRYDTNSSDSLIIYISTDCGDSFNRIIAYGEDGTGGFATAGLLQQDFTPEQETDWCISGTVGTDCFTINLDAYAGYNNVIIKFESYNNNGNNLFLDNINIDGIVVPYDIGISQIINPQGSICAGDLNPEITLKNFGSAVITSANIYFQLNNDDEELFEWTGSLDPGESSTVILPTIIPETGNNTFMVYTAEPNGNEDQNPSNDDMSVDFEVITHGISIPFTEDFESGSFETNNWTTHSPDVATTWDLYNVGGTSPGNYAAGINFFFYEEVGERDAIISPAFNFSGHTEILLDFEHAYRRYDQSSSDSLIIYVSTDCGQTYERIFQAGEDGTGSFATVVTSTVNFIPGEASDWCHTGDIGSDCFTLDISEYAGNELVYIKFESYNNNGNNLFIDNINIQSIGEMAPTADFSAVPTTIEIGETVQFTDLSTGAPTSWFWEFEGGTPETSTDQHPEVTYNSIGTFNVSLYVENALGSDEEVKINYISVVDEVIECDFMDNIDDDDEIVFYMAETGYLAGQNNYEFTEFAEYYSNPPETNLTGVSIGVAKADAMSVNPIITVKVWENSGGLPGTVIYSQDFSYNLFTPGAYNYLQFDEQTTVPDEFFIGYQVYYENPIDTFAVFQVQDRGEGSSIESTGYIRYQNMWYNADDLFQDGFNTAYLVSPELCPGGPVAEFTAQNTEGCGSTTVEFTDLSQGEISFYFWDFGDGNDSEEQNPQHHYDEPGTYTVSLTVSNSIGSDTYTLSELVTVYPNPNIDLGDDVFECGSVEINAGEGFDNYSWNGTPGTQTIIITESGNYELVVEDNNGCTASDDIFVTIYQEPTIEFNITDVSDFGENDGEISAIVSGGSAPYYFSWDTGATSHTISNLEYGLYCLTVMDVNNCDVSDCAQVNVEGVAPNADFTWDNDSGCDEIVVQFTDQSDNSPESWLWNFGDGNSSEEQNPIHTYSNPGTFSVTLTVSNDGGNNSMTVEDLINIGETPVFEVITTPATGAQNADGSAWAEISAGIPPYQYFWSTNETTESITDLLPGNYSLVLRDAYNCASTKPFVIDWVSLVNSLESSSISIYPNPTEDIVYISTNNQDIKQIHILDISGRIIDQIISSDDIIKYNFKDMAKGVYIINVNIDRQIVTKKIILK